METLQSEVRSIAGVIGPVPLTKKANNQDTQNSDRNYGQAFASLCAGRVLNKAVVRRPLAVHASHGHVRPVNP